MSELKRVGAIEVEQDLDFQRGEWRIQRIGRVALALLALAALLGAFGNGLLANAEVSSPDGEITVKYHRIARHRSDTHLQIKLKTPSSPVRLWISAEYLRGAELKLVVPEPASSRSAGGRVEFTFDVLPGGDIEFLLTPDLRLARHVEIGLLGGPTLRFSQFVLP